MDINNYNNIINELKPYNAQLIAVSKNQSLEDILRLYAAGQRKFAENKVQLLIERKSSLPSDIEWQLIGSLQKNKVKKIASWVSLIHSVDSFDLAKTIDSAALQFKRTIPILLEIKIATELTKHGFEFNDLMDSLNSDLWNQLNAIEITGVMGMATFTEDLLIIRNEFKKLNEYFNTIKNQFPQFQSFKEISMGMSADYDLALQEGSTIVRIGSKLFT